MKEAEILKRIQYIRHRIVQLNLSLKDLALYTEAASGEYLFTGVACVMAGANKVFAYGRDSQYGSYASVKAQIDTILRYAGHPNALEYVDERDGSFLSQVDIVTNTGFIRPIDEKMIAKMRPTAVIPLMWESWEYREGEIDVAACQKKGIWIMGTNELHPSCNVLGGLKRLAERVIRQYDKAVRLDKAYILSSGRFHMAIQAELTRSASEMQLLDVFNEDDLNRLKQDREVQALILVEHQSSKAVVGGAEALVDIQWLTEKGIHPTVYHICGGVDLEVLASAGIHVFPQDVAPQGYMTRNLGDVSFTYQMDLMTGSLKVAEEMARSRKRGLGREAMHLQCLTNSPAMLFP